PAMPALEGGSRPEPTLALGSDPAAERADNLAALLAMFELGRFRRLRHSPLIANVASSNEPPRLDVCQLWPKGMFLNPLIGLIRALTKKAVKVGFAPLPNKILNL